MNLIVLAVLPICQTDAIVIKKEILRVGGIEIDLSIVTHVIAIQKEEVNFYCRLEYRNPFLHNLFLRLFLPSGHEYRLITHVTV